MTDTRWQLNNTTGGLWNTSGNWTFGVPNGVLDNAFFDISDPALSGGGAGVRTIDLGGTTRTVSILNIGADLTRTWDFHQRHDYSAVARQCLHELHLFPKILRAGRSPAALQFSSNVDIAVSNQNVGLTINDISDVGGAKGLNKFGTGELYLNGSGNFTGTSTIFAGKLIVGTGGATGELGGNVVNNSTLEFFRSGNTFVNQQISGTGDVSIKSGGVYYNNVNTYTGGTVVQSGAALGFGLTNALDAGYIVLLGNGAFDFNGLQVTGSLTGAFFDRFFQVGTSTGVIRNTSNLSVDMFANFAGERIFSGTLDYNINFTKSGAGTLFMTGDSTLVDISTYKTVSCIERNPRIFRPWQHLRQTRRSRRHT